MSLLAALALTCALQCPDPPVPAGGFAYFEHFDLPVTLSDGETTTATLRYPRDPAGPCGWPTLVFIHGLSGSQSGPAAFARTFAAAGYATLTFDVRGHETHTGFHTLWGLRDRLDVVELVEWASAAYPGLVDPSRLGLAGTSQGAILSISLAGREHLPLEPNPWRSGTYPDIDAIVVTNLTFDFFSAFSPQSAGVHCNLAAVLLGTTNSSVRFDYGLVADANRALLDRDPALWTSIVTDPIRDPRPFVARTTAPVLAMGAWDDYWFPVESMLEVLDGLPAGVPSKLYLGTVGHSTPNAAGELALRDQWRRDWFDRFLKGVANGIESGPRITYSQTPADPSDYLSVQTPWPRRDSPVWPPADSRDYPLYLRAGGQLSRVPPAGNEPDEQLSQAIDPAFGPAELIATEFRLTSIETEVVRESLLWRSPPLSAPLYFAGNPVAHLDLTALGAEWQAAVTLWDIDPAGAERYVCGGVQFSGTAGAAQNGPLAIRLGAQCYEFAAGHRVALKLSNMLVHEPPPGALLRYAPTLGDFSLTVRHDAAALSWLSLPVPESLPVSYGTSQPSSAGCLAAMSATGLASLGSTAPFQLRATQVIPDRDGLLLYGFAPKDSPLGGGTLWVSSPIQRSSLIDSGGSPATPCSGTFSYDFGARLRSGLDPALTPGRHVFAQYWYRDPQSPSLTNLTNAVEFAVLP